MQVNGDQFLKNIEKEQAKNQPTPPPHSQEEMNNYYNNFNENQTTHSELDDIRLQENKNNKQKYILFGLSLVLLFLITIVTLRLLSSDDEAKNNFTDNNLIDEKTYTFAQKDTSKVETKLDIDEIEQSQDNNKLQIQEEKLVEETQQSDLFELEKKQQENNIVEEKTVQNVILEEPIKQAVEKIIKDIPVKKETKTLEQIKPKVEIQKPVKKESTAGYYIQVGAFTKSPDKKLLNKIKANNYSYIVHKMEVKGKMYNKVLIGSYTSRNNASKELTKVKSIFNKYAYILKVNK